MFVFLAFRVVKAEDAVIGGGGGSGGGGSGGGESGGGEPGVGLGFEALDEDQKGLENLAVKILPSKHVRIGPMALDAIVKSVTEAVDKAVDDFWSFHKLYPYQQGVDLPAFPRTDFFEPRGYAYMQGNQRPGGKGRFQRFQQVALDPQPTAVTQQPPNAVTEPTDSQGRAEMWDSGYDSGGWLGPPRLDQHGSITAP